MIGRKWGKAATMIKESSSKVNVLFRANSRMQSLSYIIKLLDSAIAFVAPVLSSIDSYPYVVLAMERGIPYVTFKIAAEDLCEVHTYKNSHFFIY